MDEESEIVDGETEIVSVAQSLKVPNAWRAMAALRPACEMLEQNFDLVGEDIILALQSEAPDAVNLLDAMVSDCQHARLDEAKDAYYVAQMEERAAKSATKARRKEDLLRSVLQLLKLRNHRAPAGTPSLKHNEGKVIVTNAERVPAPFRYVKPVEYGIDKRGIAKEFDAGRRVDGAERGNSYDSISITPKIVFPTGVKK